MKKFIEIIQELVERLNDFNSKLKHAEQVRIIKSFHGELKKVWINLSDESIKEDWLKDMIENYFEEYTDEKSEFSEGTLERLSEDINEIYLALGNSGYFVEEA